MNLDFLAPTPPSNALRRAADWLPMGAVALLAAGTLVMLNAAGAGDPTWALAGGVAAGSALVLLIALGSIDGLFLLALSLPLPAFVTGDFARISPAAAVTVAVVSAWVLAYAVNDRPLEFGALPRRTVAAFLGAMVLATLFSQHKVAAVRELTDLTLMIGLLIIATHELSRCPAAVPRLVKVIVAAAGLTGAFAVVQTLGVMPNGFPLTGTSLYRATGGFGWPNELGMFMAIALPLSIHVFRDAESPGRKLVAFASLAGVAVGLVLTFSRGSWLGFLAATPVLLLVGDRRFVLRMLLSVAAAVVLLDLLLGGVIRGRAVATLSDPYVVQRLGLMITGLLMFRAHPIIGVGPGGFAESLADFGPQVPWLWDYVGSSHNAYLEFAAETGIIGFAAFVALLVSVLLVLLRGARRNDERAGTPTGERNLRRALLWSFATFCMASFSGWPFAHGIGQLAILVAAMGLALESQEQSAPVAEASRSTVRER